MERWMLCMVVVVALCGAAIAGDYSVTALTDADTSTMKARLGMALDETWEIGGLASWFAEDPGPDWGLGGYLKLAVDPNGSVPVANWLPGVGEWLNLPESMPATTYLIGEVQVIPYDDGPQITGAVGAGAQVGPLLIEYLYHLVESGDSGDPMLSSGAELWLGARLEF